MSVFCWRLYSVGVFEGCVVCYVVCNIMKFYFHSRTFNPVCFADSHSHHTFSLSPFYLIPPVSFVVTFPLLPFLNSPPLFTSSPLSLVQSLCSDSSSQMQETCPHLSSLSLKWPFHTQVPTHTHIHTYSTSITRRFSLHSVTLSSFIHSSKSRSRHNLRPISPP